MPDVHGELTYSEAVAAGLYPTYGPEAGDASEGLVTYGIDGPGIEPHFGNDGGGPTPIVVPAERP